MLTVGIGNLQQDSDQLRVYLAFLGLGRREFPLQRNNVPGSNLLEACRLQGSDLSRRHVRPSGGRHAWQDYHDENVPRRKVPHQSAARDR